MDLGTVGGVVIAALGVFGGLWSLYEARNEWARRRNARDLPLSLAVSVCRAHFEGTIRQGSIADGQLGFPDEPDDEIANIDSALSRVRSRQLRRLGGNVRTHRQALIDAAFPYKPHESDMVDIDNFVPPIDIAGIPDDEVEARKRKQVDAATQGLKAVNDVAELVARRHRWPLTWWARPPRSTSS